MGSPEAEFAKNIADQLSEAFDGGVRVFKIDGNDWSMKPFVTETKDGNHIIHDDDGPRVVTLGNEKKKKKSVKPEYLEKLKKLLYHQKVTTVIREFFEIRHIKNQPEINGKVAHVIKGGDMREGHLFDNRLICHVEGVEKALSLQQSNLIDRGADIKDITGTKCVNGHVFTTSEAYLTDDFVEHKLGELIIWTKMEKKSRPDQLYRLGLIVDFIAGNITEIKCKPFPEYDGLEDMDDEEAFAACLATLKPGCVGDNYVHFNKLNHFMCDCEELVDMRFMEFILTGMCHACQAHYIERQDIEDGNVIGDTYIKCSRTETIKDLQFEIRKPQEGDFKVTLRH